MNYYFSLFQFIIVAANFKIAIQETLLCGQATFNVQYHPTFVFSTKNSTSHPTTNTPISSHYTPSKFKYVSLGKLQLNTTDLCSLPHIFGGRNLPEIKMPTLTDLDTYPNTKIITKCAYCHTCIDSLSDVHQYLRSFAAYLKVETLIIMIPHAKDAYAFPLQQKRDPFEKENVYFAYTSDDPDDSTTSCESENPSDSEALRNFSKTSVMFVSISFIILMVVSCCWLAWYYLQRFRYAHAKDRMQRRLFTAAKKALTKIPTRPIKAGDKELELECPVCIDQFQPGDILRILLCHHIFHKACVDPWLLEQRVCCVCRQDILKATGYNISSGGKRRHIGPFGSLSQSHDDRDLGDTLSTVSNPINLEHNDDVNIPDSDHSSTEIHSTISEHGRYAYRFNGEIQDPFTYGTPAPQLVQVINPGNTKKFNIIPLTVHAMPDSRKGKNKCDITGTIEYNDPSKRPCSEPICGNKRSSSSNYEDSGVIKEIGRQSFSSINSGGRKQSLSNNSNSVNPRVQVVNLVSICNSKVNENVKSKEMEDTINGSIMEAPKPGLTISSSRPTALFRNMTKSVNHETDMSSGEGMPGFIQEPQRSQIFHDDLNTAKVVAVHQPSKN